MVAGTADGAMNALADFHFLRPWCLLALLPFGYVCWRLFRRGDAAGVWQTVCDDALLPYLLVPRTAARNRLHGNTHPRQNPVQSGPSPLARGFATMGVCCA